MREAGLEAFGDFSVLERDLDRYLTRIRMGVFVLKPEMLKIAPTVIRRLSAGEAAILPVRIRSTLGVDDEQAKALLAQARPIAARFPADAAAQAALAEAEYDAGNDKEAIAAADAALKLDPGQVNAYVQKGYALFRMAETADDCAAAYRKARDPFLDLNARENDHPIPLIYNYYSYVRCNREPTPIAIDGLVRAMQIAPFDLGLRMTLAGALIRKGRLDEAKIALRPVAFNPHGKELAEGARRVIARIDAEPNWRGLGMEALVAGSGPDTE
jgi:tetratricopeptide (TPR) repeat protein